LNWVYRNKPVANYFFLAGAFAGAFLAGAFLAGAFFGVAIVISIKNYT
jgi:hypothetical protein